MIAPASCGHANRKKNGRNRNGSQRFKCIDCGKTFTEDRIRPIGNMRIDLRDAEMALKLMLEGMSVRATQRMTGISRDALCDLIVTVGENCEKLMNSLEGVTANDVEIDEIWSFVGAKQKNANRYDHGDSWTFIAIERETRMVLAFREGERDQDTCRLFLRQLNKATAGESFQVSSDGLGAYTHNVPFELGSRVSFAQLIKNYASSQTETRYSPATIISGEKKARFGNPDMDRVCASHVERLNLTLRMQSRRFTRLTNAHSKSLDHHKGMLAIFFAWYNFCRVHASLRGQTPAMASGLTGKPLTMVELLNAAAEI